MFKQACLNNEIPLHQVWDEQIQDLRLHFSMSTFYRMFSLIHRQILCKELAQNCRKMLEEENVFRWSQLMTSFTFVRNGNSSGIRGPAAEWSSSEGTSGKHRRSLQIRSFKRMLQIHANLTQEVKEWIPKADVRHTAVESRLL